MTAPRRARRVDANQSDIVTTLRAMGVRVDPVNAEGHDLLVGVPGRVLIVEVKDGAKPPSARKLTDAEEDMRRAYGSAYRVVETVDDAISVARELRVGALSDRYLGES